MIFKSGENLAENNINWRGDRVKQTGLHAYIRRHLPEPELCENCELVSPKELSNKTGIYDRNLENWWYLCVKCHREYDGTVTNLNKGIPFRYNKIDMTDRKCSRCGSTKTYPSKHGPNRAWCHIDNELVCHKCYMRNRRAKLRLSRGH